MLSVYFGRGINQKTFQMEKNFPDADPSQGVFKCGPNMYCRLHLLHFVLSRMTQQTAREKTVQADKDKCYLLA